jgi:hypothetical protein
MNASGDLYPTLKNACRDAFFTEQQLFAFTYILNSADIIKELRDLAQV